MRTRTKTGPPPVRSPALDLPMHVDFGGHRTLLRLLRPDDAERLMVFFATHTAETVRQRYGYTFTEMTPEHAAKLVGVDQTRDAALGVFETVHGEERLVAVGRYCLTPDGRTAEVAFVVHEQRRSLGIASTLLHVLATIALQRGLTDLTAQVQRDNAPMVAVFRRAGARFEPLEGTGTFAVRIALRDAAARRGRASLPKPERTWVPARARHPLLPCERAFVHHGGAERVAG